MSAPLRISRPAAQARRGASVQPQENFNAYLDRLTKMIPTPVIALYLVGMSQILSGQTVGLLVWSVICLIGVIALIVYGTSDLQAKLPPDWTHAALSAVAFVIWMYAMGGVFAAYNLQVPWVGSLAVLAYTFFVPMFYRGPSEG